MKIGILTFHRAHNYGAFLQCYALQEYLKLQGNDVFVLDYKPWYFKKDYALLNLGVIKSLSVYRKIRRLFGNALLFFARLLRFIAFEKSINSYLNLDNTMFSEHKNSELSKYDVIFFGSDQIWNPKITRGMDNVFWGDFVFNGKKIAYAVSAGDDYSILENKMETVKKNLCNFSAISVREKKLEEYLKCINVFSKTVLDPTLLLNAEQWTFFSSGKDIKQKYLLLYIMKPSLEAMKIAEKIAAELNLKIKIIYNGVKANPKSWKNAFFEPKDFVRFFRDAQFIVTTSFHGTSFAVNFKKQFYAVNNGESNYRVESLLEMLDLMDRYISDASEINPFQKVKYDDDLLEKAREFSITFIKESVKDSMTGGGGYECIVNTSCTPSSFKRSSFLEAA